MTIINSENWDDCTQISDEFKLGVKEGKRQAFEDVEKMIDKIFYLKGKDTHPPFKEIKTPIISIDKLLEFEFAIEELKEKK